jgi:hypothetical protein
MIKGTLAWRVIVVISTKIAEDVACRGISVCHALVMVLVSDMFRDECIHNVHDENPPIWNPPYYNGS